MKASYHWFNPCLAGIFIFFIALQGLPSTAQALSMVDQDLDQVWKNTSLDLDQNGTPDGGLVRATMFNCQPSAFGRMCSMRVDEWLSSGDVSLKHPVGSFFKFQALSQNSYSAIVENNSGDAYVLFLRPHDSGDPVVMSMKVGRIVREPVSTQSALSSTQFRETMIDPWSAPQTNGPENVSRKTGTIIHNDFQAFRSRIQNLKVEGENK